MIKFKTMWKKLLISVLGALMVVALALGLVSIKSASAVINGASYFQSFIQYTRAKDESGNQIEGDKAGWVITGFEYIAGSGEKVVFGNPTEPAVIPAFHSAYGEASLPVIGIAQGVFAGYPLGVVKFEQIQRNINDAENNRQFELLSHFELSDTGASFKVTGADYGTAMLSIGGYDVDGKKLSDTVINADAEYRAGVFQGCQDLTEITLPGTVKEMGPGIFNQSYVVNVKSTAPLGGVYYNTARSGVITEFGSMQGLLYLKKIPYRAFYYSQKLATLVFPDYEESAGTRFIRANYNSSDPYLHAHEENGTAYFVPIYGGSGATARADTSAVIKELNQKAGLNELGEDAFYYTNDSRPDDNQLNGSLAGFPDINANKVGTGRLYLAGITKMGGESLQKINLKYDMGKYVAPGTVEGLPGGDGSGNLVAWSSLAPNYATFTNNVTYVFNTATGKVCGFNYTWGQSDRTVIGDKITISIPQSVGGTPVTGISDGAFTNTAATGLNFASNMSPEFKEIGATTFRSSKLQSITNLPDTIEKIAYHAFEQTTSLTRVTTSSTAHVDTSKTNNFDAFIMPTSIKQIDHRAFRSTKFETIYFPGNGDNGTFDIAATAFTESTSIKSMYFAGWNGSAYEKITPNEIDNWPWSANNAVMSYNTSTSTYDWSSLGAARNTDTTGIWEVYYNPANPDEAYLMGVDLSKLKSLSVAQERGWYSTYAQIRNLDEYRNLNLNWSAGAFDLKLPEKLDIGDNKDVTITGIGAPEGDLSFFNISTGQQTGIYINKLTIPKYAKKVTTATFKDDKTKSSPINLYIDIVEFEWDKDDKENTGVEYIGLSAFLDCGLRYLYLPEYSLKKIDRTAFSGNNLQHQTLVIPGNVEYIDPTAFQPSPSQNKGLGTISYAVQRIYVMQYSQTPSDGLFNLMAGKYNNFGLNGAGSMGLTTGQGTNATAVPVYFVDQFRPEFYEVGKLDNDNEWKALVAEAETSENGGAYDLPYIYPNEATPQFVHPILNSTGDFTGEVEIRFGVRMLLQESIGRVYDVTDLNGSNPQNFTKTPQPITSVGKDFYVVQLSGITANDTYTFRVEYRNEALVNALKENHFDYYTGELFVSEFSIDVNVFSTLTYDHALSMNSRDKELLPTDPTPDVGIALYIGNAYEYEQKTVDGGIVYRRKALTADNIKTSRIHLSEMGEGTLSNSAYAKFIGWTTDTNMAGSLQLDVPEVYSESNTSSKFFLAGQDCDPYPLDVILGENNTSGVGRLYSVFRYVINNDVNNAGVDEALGWVYGENPLTSQYNGKNERGSRLPQLNDNVSSGDNVYLTLIEKGNPDKVYKQVNVAANSFTSALGELLSPKLPVGTYQLYGGKIESSEISNLANRAAISGIFSVSPLPVTIKTSQAEAVYGIHTIGKDQTGEKMSVEDYLYTVIQISPTEELLSRVASVPDEYNAILNIAISSASKNAFEAREIYPNVGTYSFGFTSDNNNYTLSANELGKALSYTVTPRLIDITDAGINIDKNPNISKTSVTTYTWEYEGKDFLKYEKKYNELAEGFGVTNYMNDADDWTNAYSYVWYVEGANGVYTKVAENGVIKNAGNYRLYIQWDDQNYTIDSVNRAVNGGASSNNNSITDSGKTYVFVCNAIITKATFRNIEILNNEKTYNGSLQGGDVTVTAYGVIGESGEEKFPLVLTTIVGSNTYTFTDAGSHPVSYSITGYDNYNDFNGVYEVIINAADIEVSDGEYISGIIAEGKEYNGTQFSFVKSWFEYESSALDVGNVPFDSVTFQYYVDNNWGTTAPKNAGTYRVRLYISTNYNITNGPAEANGSYYELTFTITPYNLNEHSGVTAEGSSTEFNADYQSVIAKSIVAQGPNSEQFSVTSGTVGATNTAGLTIQYSVDRYSWENEVPARRDVNNYTIYFRLTGSNYVDYIGSYTFDITPAEFASLTSSVGNIKGEYSGEYYGNTVVITATGLAADDIFKNGLTITYKYSSDGGSNWTASQTVPSFKNAGTYLVEYTVWHVNYYYQSGSAKYFGEENPYVGEYTIEISQKALTFEPLVKVFTYNGSNQGAFELSASGLVEGEGNTDYRLQFWTVGADGQSDITTSMPTFLNAGKYTVYFRVAAGSNYTCAANSSYEVLIIPAKVTAEATEPSVEYNGEAQYSGVRFSSTINGLPPTVFGADLEFNQDGKCYVFSDGSVGTTETATDKTLVYILTLEKNGGYTVVKNGGYTVTVEFVSGGNFAFEVEYTNANNPETYTYTYTGSYTYNITPTFVSAALGRTAIMYEEDEYDPANTPADIENLFVSINFTNKNDENSAVPEFRIGGSGEYELSYIYPNSSVSVFHVAGNYYVVITLTSGGNFAFERGSGSNYVYVATLLFVINPIEFDENTEVEVIFEDNVSLVYTGYAITPGVKSVTATWYNVDAGGRKEFVRSIELKAGEYSIDYANNINVGINTATIIVYGISNFGGTIQGTFSIIPKSLGEGENGDSYSNGQGISVTTNLASYVYSGSEISVVPTVKYESDSSLAAVTLPSSAYTLTYEQKINGVWTAADNILNAGQYRIIITGNNGVTTGNDGKITGLTGSGNYMGVYYHEFTVEKAELTVEFTTSAGSSIQYNGTEYLLENYISFKNLSNTNVTPAYTSNPYNEEDNKYGDKYDISINYNGQSVETVKNAGSYIVTISISSNFKWANTVSVVGDTVVLTFVIEKASVRVSLNSTAGIYSGEDHLKPVEENSPDGVYAVFNNTINTGVLPAYSSGYTLSFWHDGKELTAGDLEFKNAGTYTVRVTLIGEGLTNFQIIGADNNSIDLQYTITPAELNVILNNSSSTYEKDVEITLKDYIQLMNVSGVNSITPNTDNVYVYYGTEEANTTVQNAGKYYVSIVLKGDDANNFVFSVTEKSYYYSEGDNSVDDSYKLIYTITPARVTLDAFASPVYNGEEQAVEITFFNDNGIAIDLTASEYSISYSAGSTNAKVGSNGIPLNAGTYSVNITLTEAGNYMFSVNRTGGEVTYTYELSRDYVIQTRQLTAEDITAIDGLEGDINSGYSTTYKYNSETGEGEAHQPVPTVTVKFSEQSQYLLKGITDYTVNYRDNVEASYSYIDGRDISGRSPAVLITGQGNFSGTVELNFRIYQIQLAFELAESSATYDRQAHPAKVKVFTYLGEGSQKVELSESEVGSYTVRYYTLVNGEQNYLDTAPINSGTYYVEISLPSQGNYYVLSTIDDNGQPNVQQSAYEYAKYVVEKIQLTVTISGTQNVYYNGYAQFATVTLSGDGSVLPAQKIGDYPGDYSITYTSGTDSADISPVNAGNYILTFTLINDTNFVVNEVIIEGVKSDDFSGNVVSHGFVINKARIELSVTKFSDTYKNSEYNLVTENILSLTNHDTNVLPVNYDSVSTESNFEQTYPDRYRVTYEALEGGALSNNRPKNAGKYTVTIELTDNFTWYVVSGDNVVFSSDSNTVTVNGDGNATFTFTITQVVIQVTLTQSTAVYKGEAYTASEFINVTNSANPGLVPANADGAVEGDTYTVTANADLLNADSYTLTVTINGGNYLIYMPEDDNVTVNTYSFTITPAIVTVNYSDSTQVYNGEEWNIGNLVFTNSANESVVPTATAELEINKYELSKNGNFTTVGTHTVTITLKEGGNFSFETAAYQFVYEKVITYTITPATITVSTKDGSWFNGHNGVNDGDEIKSTYTVAEYYKPYGDAPDYDGAYKLIITADSFKLFGDATANVTVMSIEKTGYYASTANYAVDGSGYYVFLTRGTYVITVRVEDSNGNHNSATFTVEVTILQNDIKITLKDDAELNDTYGNVRTFTEAYGKSILSDFYALIEKITGVPGYADDANDEATLAAKIAWLDSLGFNIAISNADYSTTGYLKATAYPVVINLPDSANNKVVFNDGSANGSDTAVGLFRVAKLAVEVDWGEYFEAGFVYDGTDINANTVYKNSIKIQNALEFDDVNFILDNIQAGHYAAGNQFSAGAINVGEYTLRILSGLNGVDAANYSFSGAQKDFEIASRIVNISIADSVSIYGDDYKNSFTYTYFDSVLSGDETAESGLRAFILNLLELQLDGRTVENPQVGTTYTVTTQTPTVEYLTNYTLNFIQNGTHKLSAKFITVTATVSSIYGDDAANVSEIKWFATGLANGDTEDDLNLSFTINTTTAVNLRAVGDYTEGAIVLNEGYNANYSITVVGTYTVAPRPITIVPDTVHIEYGASLPSLDSLGWTLKAGSTLAYEDSKDSIKISFSYEPVPENTSVLPNVGDVIYVMGKLAEDSSNYVVTIESARVEIVARSVVIEIGSYSSVYGTVHKGDVINLVYAENLNNSGTWTYVSGSILDKDLVNLAFYLEEAMRTPEQLYAQVGSYSIKGTWGYITNNATAINNYEIEFRFNDGTYLVTEAEIKEGAGANWNYSSPYRVGSENDYSDEAGWYAMTISPSVNIVLAGDYVLTDDSVLQFKSYNENYIEYVAYAGTNGIGDEGVIIRYYLPTFKATDVNTEAKLYYDNVANVWRIHSVGEWSMTIEVIQYNHTTATFTLTYTILPVTAVVSLDPLAFTPALELTYGYDVDEINAELQEFVLGESRMRDSIIVNISGLESLGGTVEDWYKLLQQYCTIEIVPVADYLSTSGKVIVGTYSINIKATDNSGFSATFASGDYDGADRLVINKAELTMVWAEDEYDTDNVQIVTVGDDMITYLYTGKAYAQAPKFNGVLPEDQVNAPGYGYKLPNGAETDAPRNVLADGSYVLYVLNTLTGADSGNYALPENLSIALKIIPRDITVTIGNETSIYGQYTEAQISQMLSDIEKYVSASWLGEGDNITSLNVELTKQAGLNAAAYAISGVYENLNYNVTFVNGTYTVTPKQITVTIGDIVKTFGDDIADLNANYTAEGVLEGDTLDVTFEIEGATYYAGYLEVSDNAAGYAIVGHDNDSNYEITFVGNWSNGISGIYKVNKAANEWIQWFLFESFTEGGSPEDSELPVAKYGSAVIEYYYDEEMTQLVEVPLSELEAGMYYARACVNESKNFEGIGFENFVFEVIPPEVNFEILSIVILLAVETIALTCGLIFVRRRKNKNNN